MVDWKEGMIEAYHSLEREKERVEYNMVNNLTLSKFRLEIKDIESEIEIKEGPYKVVIVELNAQMQKIREDLIERWDSEDKSFKCGAGSATIRTTRALKIDNKEMLISILQHIGKLTQCIKGWDLTYLRKLADAGLFDADVGETNIVHYDEKKNVVISAIGEDKG